jgi:hypothetical protein
LDESSDDKSETIERSKDEKSEAQNQLTIDLKQIDLNECNEGSANSSLGQLLPPNLELPSTQYWNVLLLEAKNNQEIIMRLADTSEQYLDFLDRLCALYQQPSTVDAVTLQVSQVISGRIYAAVFNGCTLRVQALQSEPNLDSSEKTVRCMYVDESGIEQIPIGSLREIPDDLLQLPFQAFSVGLANLRSNEQDERVADLLQKMILEADSGLVLVAEPLSRSDPIQVLLYDTSGSDDIVLNDLLREMVINLDEAGVQQLPPIEPISLQAEKPIDNDQSVAHPSEPSKCESSSSEGELRSVKPLPTELCGAKSIPPAQLPEINPRPKCGEEFWYVTLSVPVSPNNFVLHERSADDESQSPYERLCREMQELYDDEEPIELHGSLILARQLLAIKDQDGKWKRARVQALLSPEPDFSVLVQLLDEGGVRVLALSQVQPLYSQFAQLPIQAMRASLHDIQPLETDWSPLAVYQFGQLVQDQQFRAVVHQVMQVDGEPLLQVTLYRQSDGSSVSDDLVRLKLAKQS